MVTFELASLLINTTIVTLVVFNVRRAMWGVFLVFALGTIGNLLSASLLEKALFTPVTALLSFLAYRLTKK
jgi:hypothetical protein